jgi:hypothetical protein
MELRAGKNGSDTLAGVLQEYTITARANDRCGLSVSEREIAFAISMRVWLICCLASNMPFARFPDETMSQRKSTYRRDPKIELKAIKYYADYQLPWNTLIPRLCEYALQTVDFLSIAGDAPNFFH